MPAFKASGARDADEEELEYDAFRNTVELLWVHKDLRLTTEAFKSRRSNWIVCIHRRSDVMRERCCSIQNSVFHLPKVMSSKSKARR